MKMESLKETQRRYAWELQGAPALDSPNGSVRVVTSRCARPNLVCCVEPPCERSDSPPIARRPARSCGEVRRRQRSSCPASTVTTETPRRPSRHIINVPRAQPARIPVGPPSDNQPGRERPTVADGPSRARHEARSTEHGGLAGWLLELGRCGVSPSDERGREETQRQGEG